MISSILLAAGKSKRMNGENKLLKKYKNILLINYAINNILNSSIDEVIIVLGYQKEIIERMINKNKKIKFVFNKNFESGIASSIKIGLNNISENSKAFFVCLADMPFINHNIYNSMIQSLNCGEIIVPVYDNQQGNPVLFSINIKKEIMKIDGDIGAKKILQKNKEKVFNLHINDKAIISDFNTPESFKS